jgi:hypothetical protein
MKIEAKYYLLPAKDFDIHWKPIKAKREAILEQYTAVEVKHDAKIVGMYASHQGLRHVTGLKFNNEVPEGWRESKNEGWFYVPNNNTKPGKAINKWFKDLPSLPMIAFAAKQAGVFICGIARLHWHTTGFKLLENGDLLIAIHKHLEWQAPDQFQLLKASEFYAILENEPNNDDEDNE